MREFNETNLTEAVADRFDGIRDDRLREVMGSLVRHLHDFVREVDLTEDEWAAAIQFLTATGQISDDSRQEFILLSDVLGVSALVDTINHRVPAGATQSTVVGPFYVQDAPYLENGHDMTVGVDIPGEHTWVEGRVLALDGAPIADATVDVWQTRPDSLYDVQDEDSEMQMRGRFRTDGDGRFWYRTYKPVSYPVPGDGPVGQILRAVGGHGMRPAHIHAAVSAPGYQRVVTHIFPDGDEYLDSDTVFAVKESLIVDFRTVDSAEEASRLGMPCPFLRVDFDFRLVPESPEAVPVVGTAEAAQRA
ncbi:MAG: intradiol ring-cleavage dioxygenase [Dehalococcoidia bacterium]